MKVKILEKKEVVTKIQVEDEHLIDRKRLAEILAKMLGREKPYTPQNMSIILTRGEVKNPKMIQALRDIPIEDVKFERKKRKSRRMDLVN